MSKSIISEYVRNLSDEDVKFICNRSERLSGDVPDVLNFAGKNRGIDYHLSISQSAFELYDKCDLIIETAQREHSSRNLK